MRSSWSATQRVMRRRSVWRCSMRPMRSCIIGSLGRRRCRSVVTLRSASSVNQSADARERHRSIDAEPAWLMLIANCPYDSPIVTMTIVEHPRWLFIGADKATNLVVQWRGVPHVDDAKQPRLGDAASPQCGEDQMAEDIEQRFFPTAFDRRSDRKLGRNHKLLNQIGVYSPQSRDVARKV